MLQRKRTRSLRRNRRQVSLHAILLAGVIPGTLHADHPNTIALELLPPLPVQIGSLQADTVSDRRINGVTKNPFCQPLHPAITLVSGQNVAEATLDGPRSGMRLVPLSLPQQNVEVILPTAAHEQPGEQGQVGAPSAKGNSEASSVNVADSRRLVPSEERIETPGSISFSFSDGGPDQSHHGEASFIMSDIGIDLTDVDSASMTGLPQPVDLDDVDRPAKVPASHLLQPGNVTELKELDAHSSVPGVIRDNELATAFDPSTEELPPDASPSRRLTGASKSGERPVDHESTVAGDERPLDSVENVHAGFDVPPVVVGANVKLDLTAELVAPARGVVLDAREPVKQIEMGQDQGSPQHQKADVSHSDTPATIEYSEPVVGTASPIGGVFDTEAVGDATVRVAPARVQAVRSERPIQSFAIDNDAICQVIAISGHELRVVGQHQGDAKLAVWLESEGKVQPHIYAVKVTADVGHQQSGLQSTADRLTKVIATSFPTSQVQVVVHQEKLVLQGMAVNNEQARNVLRLVRQACLVPVIDQLRAP